MTLNERDLKEEETRWPISRSTKYDNLVRTVCARVSVRVRRCRVRAVRPVALLFDGLFGGRVHLHFDLLLSVVKGGHLVV